MVNSRAVEQLSDDELKAELLLYGFHAGPVTGTTRRVLEKKLEAYRSGSNTISASRSRSSSKGRSNQTLSGANKSPAISRSNTASVVSTSSSKGGGTGGTGRQRVIIDSDSSGGGGNELLDNSSGGSIPTTPSPVSVRRHQGSFDGSWDHPTPPVPKPAILSAASKKSLGAPRTLPSLGSGGKPVDSSSIRSLSPTKAAGKKSVQSSTTVTGKLHRGMMFKDDCGAALMDTSAGSGGSTSLSFDSSNYDDDDEDDHMESSRIIPRSTPPVNKSYFGGRPSTTHISPIGLKKNGTINKRSSLDRITDLGRSAWGYFSRPIGESTPCSEDKFIGGVRPGKYRRTDGYQSFISESQSCNGSLLGVSIGNGDEALHTSRWILWGVFGLLALLSLGYAGSTHPEAIREGYHIARDLVRDIVKLLYAYAVLPFAAVIIVGLIGVLVFQAWKWYRDSQRDLQRRLMGLVEHITECIEKNGIQGIPEHHVRDMLLPPTKRSPDDMKLWRRASDFINAEDSRVRTEVRLIDGVECSVWLWAGVATSSSNGNKAAIGEWQGAGKPKSVAATMEFVRKR